MNTFVIIFFIIGLITTLFGLVKTLGSMMQDLVVYFATKRQETINKIKTSKASNEKSTEEQLKIYAEEKQAKASKQ